MGLAAAQRDFFFGEQKQKDFCQTREVLTLACSDVGGLALTFDLTCLLHHGRLVVTRRVVLGTTRIKTIAHRSSGTRTRNLLIIGPRTHRGARSFCQRERCTSSKFCESTRAPSRNKWVQLLCSVFADALVRFQFSMFADGVACVQKRAHPDLNQGPADLQSAALTTELCTQLQRGRCHPFNRF